MSRSRRRAHKRSKSYSSITRVCGIVIIVALVVGGSLPTASFSHGEVPRGAGVDVTDDENAALSLDIAQAVYINGTSDLVNVTNHLGHDVTITVTLRDDSTDIGDLIVNDVNDGNETSFTLTQGATETVRIEIPDDSSLTDEVVYFHVNVSAPGLTAKARDRGVPVDA